MDRLARLAAIRHPPGAIAEKSSRIYRATLERSGDIRSGNFEAIGLDDLRRLYELYDGEFFGGLIGRMLREDGPSDLRFRLANRMTSAGGKTFFRKARRGRGPGSVEWREYEIAVSTFLLFQTFREVDRPIPVAGLICGDRLEALQRVFEHELLHLAEFLATGHVELLARASVPGAWRGRSVRPRLAWNHRPGDAPRGRRQGRIRSGSATSSRSTSTGTTRVGRVNRITKTRHGARRGPRRPGSSPTAGATPGSTSPSTMLRKAALRRAGPDARTVRAVASTPRARRASA